MNGDLANYELEHSSFEEMFEEDCSTRILLFRGDLGTGTTALLRACRRAIAESSDKIIVISIDLTEKNDVRELLAMLLDERYIGPEKLSLLNNAIEILNPQANKNIISIARTSMIGWKNRIKVVLDTENQDVWSERLTILTRTLFRDLHALSPTLILFIFDHFQEATRDVKTWLKGSFLSWVATTKNVRVVLAGTEVPLCHNVEKWGDSCKEHELKGVGKPEDWLPVMHTKYPGYSNEYWLSLLKPICILFRGLPDLILKVIVAVQQMEEGKSHLEKLLKKLEEIPTETDREWQVIDFCLQSLEKSIREAIWAASVTHWFDLDYLAAIMDHSDYQIFQDSGGLEMLSSFPFIEQASEGFRVHEHTRTHLQNKLDPNRQLKYGRRAAQHSYRWYEKSKDPRWLFELIDHLLSVNETEQGIKMLQKAGEKWLGEQEYQLVERLVRVIRKNENIKFSERGSGWISYLAAQLNIHYGEFASAVENLNRINITTDKDSYLSAHHYKTLGEAYEGLGIYESASNYYTQAEKIYTGIGRREYVLAMGEAINRVNQLHKSYQKLYVNVETKSTSETKRPVTTVQPSTFSPKIESDAGTPSFFSGKVQTPNKEKSENYVVGDTPIDYKDIKFPDTEQRVRPSSSWSIADDIGSKISPPGLTSDPAKKYPPAPLPDFKHQEGKIMLPFSEYSSSGSSNLQKGYDNLIKDLSNQGLSASQLKQALNLVNDLRNQGLSPSQIEQILKGRNFQQRIELF